MTGRSPVRPPQMAPHAGAGHCAASTAAVLVALTAIAMLHAADSPVVIGEAASHITVGVADLERALDLWVRRFGLTVIAERRGADPELARLWGLAPDRIVAQALVGLPGEACGRIHFVQFRDPEAPVRAGAAPTARAPKNLDVRARDLPDRYEELLALGHRFRSRWVEYPIDADRVREVQMPGPDETNIVLAEVVGERLPYTAAGYTSVSSIVTVVGDGAVEAEFFQSVLGLPLVMAHRLTGPEIEQMVGLPPGAGLDMRLLGSRRSPFGRIEIVRYEGVDGEDRYARARPPATGALGVVFMARDLAPIRTAAARAGRAVTEHGEVRTIFGEGRVLGLRSPAGLRIEIHERPVR